MSEAASLKDDAQPAPEAPTPPASPTASRRGNGLALLALLLGAAGVAVGGLSLWQLRGLDARDRQQLGQLEDVRAQAQAQAQREQRLTERLDRLPSIDELEQRRRLLADLQGEQQRLSQRVETVLGASRQDWRLAEAEHLLRLASLRLSALQDVNSARALVQGADEILREQDDPAAFAAREQLAKSLEALRSLPQPDRTGLFLQLAALREQAERLTPMAPEFVSAEGQGFAPAVAEGDGSSRWDQWWEKLSRYVRVDFDADDEVRPLLTGQSLQQVRLALSLALEQAQWAALHGESEIFHKALEQAGAVLKGQFNQENPESRAVLARIDELATQPVEVEVPDLSASLSALQAYVQRRQVAAEAVPEPSAGAGEEGSP